MSGAPGEPPAPQPTSCRLQFAGAPFSGLVGVTPDGGARLLLFPSEGGLFLFTGERARGLTIAPAPAGRITLDYAGPLLRFPDTVPFLDLERGLATAHLVDADVRLAFTPAHACGETGSFGTVAGSVVLDGRRIEMSATAFAEDAERAGPWPRVRVALRLDRTTALNVTVGLDGRDATGFLCRAGTHAAVTAARVRLGPPPAPLAHLALEVEIDGGERVSVDTSVVHELPVVRSRGAAAVRVVFAACAVDGSATPAGWCEAGGI